MYCVYEGLDVIEIVHLVFDESVTFDAAPLSALSTHLNTIIIDSYTQNMLTFLFDIYVYVARVEVWR